MEAHIKFAKLKEDAKIPSKREEDAGLDIYACFEQDYVVIPPHGTQMIPTGIASACDKDYALVLRERGSTGSKGIALRAGVVDSGYRDEIFVALTNTTDAFMFISKLPEENTYQDFWGRVMQASFCYPYEKAIAQALVVPVPKTTIEIVPYEDLKNIESERGIGALGSSGK